MQEQLAIEQLKQGNIAGLEILVQQYQTKAMRAAFLILHNASQAEDVVADAFIRAYEKIGSFNAEKPFGPWFYQIVVNLARRRLKNQKRLVPFQTFQTGPDSALSDVRSGVNGNPARTVEEQEEYAVLWQAVRALPVNQCLVVVQHYYLGMSIEEISALGHVPQGTVKWRLHTARKRLRDAIGE